MYVVTMEDVCCSVVLKTSQDCAPVEKKTQTFVVGQIPHEHPKNQEGSAQTCHWLGVCFDMWPTNIETDL